MKSTNISSVTLMTLVLLITTSDSPAQPPTTIAATTRSVTKEQWRNLTRQELIDATLAGMRTRDGRLRNLSFEAIERQTPKGIVNLRQLRFSRGMDGYWLDSLYTEGGGAGLAHRVSWDGKTCVFMSRGIGEAAPPDGYGITPIEDPALGELPLMDQLGIRKFSPVGAYSLADWIAGSVTHKGFETTVQYREEGGVGVVVFTFKHFYQTNQYEIDPALGFLITRSFVRIVNKDGSLRDHDEVVSEQVKEFEGVALPYRVVRTITMGNKPPVTIEWNITKVAFHNLFDDMEVPLKPKPNSIVVNDIEHEAYTILPSGEKKPEAYFDPRTGESRPPKKPSTNSSPAQ